MFRKDENNSPSETSETPFNANDIHEIPTSYPPAIVLSSLVSCQSFVDMLNKLKSGVTYVFGKQKYDNLKWQTIVGLGNFAGSMLGPELMRTLFSDIAGLPAASYWSSLVSAMIMNAVIQFLTIYVLYENGKVTVAKWKDLINYFIAAINGWAGFYFGWRVIENLFEADVSSPVVMGLAVIWGVIAAYGRFYYVLGAMRSFEANSMPALKKILVELEAPYKSGKQILCAVIAAGLMIAACFLVLGTADAIGNSLEVLVSLLYFQVTGGDFATDHPEALSRIAIGGYAIGGVGAVASAFLFAGSLIFTAQKILNQLKEPLTWANIKKILPMIFYNIILYFVCWGPSENSPGTALNALNNWIFHYPTLTAMAESAPYKFYGLYTTAMFFALPGNVRFLSERTYMYLKNQMYQAGLIPPMHNSWKQTWNENNQEWCKNKGDNQKLARQTRDYLKSQNFSDHFSLSHLFECLSQTPGEPISRKRKAILGTFNPESVSLVNVTCVVSLGAAIATLGATGMLTTKTTEIVAAELLSYLPTAAATSYIASAVTGLGAYYATDLISSCMGRSISIARNCFRRQQLDNKPLIIKDDASPV